MDVSGAFSAVPGIADQNRYSFAEGKYFPDAFKGNHNANLQKELYNNYSYIVSIVNDAFETAADVVYNTYHKWLDFKAANPEKYKKILGMIQDYDFKHNNSFWMQGRTSIDAGKHSEEMHETWNFGLFYKLMRDYTGHRLDIPDLIDRDSYLKIVNEFRSRLIDSDRNINNEYLAFDVENAYEFMSYNNTTLTTDTVCIKVRPELRTDDKFTNLGVFYRVYIDMRSVIDTIIYNTAGLWESPSQIKNMTNVARVNGMNDPLTEEDILDNENFKTKILYYYKNYFEKIAKHICIEVLDNSITVRNGWDFFMKKFDNMYNSVVKCENYIRLNTFLKGFKRYKGGYTTDTEDRKYANTFSTFIRMCMVDKERSSLPIVDNDRFIECLLGSQRWDLNGNIDVKDTVDNLVCVMFFRAFSIYFETISNMSIFESQYSNIKAYYSREFDRDYDFEALHTAIQAVDDYVCKDFFKTALGAYNNFKFVEYDFSKFKNGEKMSFMFAKFKRKLWMAFAAELFALFDIKFKFDEACKKYHGGLNDETEGDEKFKKMFNEYYNHLLERLINNLSCYAGACGYLSNKMPYKYGNWNSEITLVDHHFAFHVTNIAYEMTRKSYGRAIQALGWVDDMVKLISEWNGQRNDSGRLVISYNATDNADCVESDFDTPENMIKNEFKRMLFEMGLLDFETASYY